MRDALEPAPFFLSIERLARSDPFSDDEKALIGEMVPHVRRATRMSTALGAAAQTGMMDALSACRQPALLLNTAGVVVNMNAAADQLIGDGITLARGRLHASDRRVDRALQALISNVCWPGAVCKTPAMDAVALSRTHGRPLIVQGAPLVNSARDIFQHARALLLVNPLDQIAEPDERLLRFAFNLTAAEAKIGRMFIGSGGLAHIANALNISIGTVRTHIKAIFLKTNTHSQSELAVLLSRVARPM